MVDVNIEIKLSQYGIKKEGGKIDIKPCPALIIP